MVEVHLYGKLRRYAESTTMKKASVVRFEAAPDETLETVIKRLGINPAEIYHIFVNGALAATHNSMAPYLCYPEACENIWEWDMDQKVGPDDRIGIFGKDMALLVV